MKRRKRGTGTIERRGELFLARLPDADRTPLIRDADRAHVERMLDAAVYQLRAGKVTTATTLGTYGRTVLDRRDREGKRGIAEERNRWKCYVEDGWACATWPIASLRRRDVVAWLRDLRARPLARQTRLNALNLLRAVLRDALDDELVDVNVAADVRVPREPTTDTGPKPLELDEFAALFWTSPGHAERVMLSVAAGVGIRQGELRSLRAADVHVGEHRPHVVIRYGTPRGATKSGKPRELPLFGVALAALRAWTPPANPLGLLFPAPHGGPRAKGKLFSNGTWAAWKRAAGITRRFPWKDLRHTCGTLLLDGDVSGRQWTKEEVQALLGHSTVKMTERYAKVTERLLRRAAEGELAVSHPQATQATADWSDIPPDVAETIEILRSRLRDLNSRPTVYETGAKRSNHDTLARLRGLCEAFLVAVVGRDPLVFRRGVALAEAALELADAPALAARRTA